MSQQQQQHACEELTLHVPTLEDLAQTLRTGLANHFHNVDVSVAQCPDLTAEPFNLVRPGLSGGQQVLLDIGGPAYLIPYAKPEEHTYDLRDIAKRLNLQEHMVIGAAAGPYDRFGHNSELAANLFTNCGCNVKVGSRCMMVHNDQSDALMAKNNSKNNSNNSPSKNPMHVLHDSGADNTKCCILGNFYASSGERDANKPVLCIRVSKRKSKVADFTECVRAALAEEYKHKPVGLGGVFAVNRGRVRVHVMDEIMKDKPMKTEEDLNNWLKFFSIQAPLVFYGEIVSYDPGYDLRIKHAHGFGPNGGGHYHNDESPEEVEYEAYYNVATKLYRIDRPDAESSKAANFGKD